MSQTAPENRGSVVAIRTVVALVVVALVVWALFHVNPADAYLWVKSLHVIAVIAWMAGMLYLPRLFVYHTAAKPGSETSETFKVMEKRLLRFIINPAMIVTWIAGLWMAWEIYGFQGGWLHAKLLLVVLMSGLHGYLSKSTRLFAEDRNMRSAKHWRIINEVPTVLMILIVILVIVKPF
ncbi:TIGR00701 family protein [Ochrobactrum sp. 695/2009]|nr:protoporphyrinogen oxidase HemJ [Brucella intermedia]PJR90871.1 TIGR00701 family protein [Ochrobactrum sp. 721/2009]PJT15844.1 TIGR00701 family protein [Ochrobactrum sp. 720/2009]PJT25664.1 TIGR00701 family protein [Ochrobactrum sp. 715/2009]PJT29270.1 TIGR00701 family protein [Ochrobactrum sp. 695/2009]PJT35186.1 TIGR00701 family protein [Ochrobactrum sp. 689/2009]